MDDYISREEAKRFFNLNFGGVSHAIIASRLLDEIPAADVSPVRHGRWDFAEHRFYHGGFVTLFRCSECSVATDMEHNYCPNCGCLMDGGINHEI